MRAYDRLKKTAKPFVGVLIPRYREVSFPDLLRQLRKWNNDQNAPSYSFNHFQGLMSYLRVLGAANPNSVLELGPGAHLGTLYCFLAAGASKAAGLDIAPTTKQPEFFHRLHAFLRVVSGFRWWRPPDITAGYQYPTSSWDDIDVDELVARIDYRAPHTADQMPFSDDEFDLIYSGAAMEHFDNPAGAVREIFRVLKPGGVTVHGIDLRSHLPGGDLSHLKMTQEQYDQTTQKYDESHGIGNIVEGSWTGHPYCNRVLLRDWKRMFYEAGFEQVEALTLAQMTPGLVKPDEFAFPYRDRSPEELAPLVVTMVGRKPAG